MRRTWRLRIYPASYNATYMETTYIYPASYNVTYMETTYIYPASYNATYMETTYIYPSSDVPITRQFLCKFLTYAAVTSPPMIGSTVTSL